MECNPPLVKDYWSYMAPEEFPNVGSKDRKMGKERKAVEY